MDVRDGMIRSGGGRERRRLDAHEDTLGMDVSFGAPGRVLALAATFATSAFGQSLCCHGDLAGGGDSKASVLQKCGKPALTDWHCKPVQPFYAQDAVAPATTVGVPPRIRVDEWTYFPGSGQFITTFRFENGVVHEMKYGDRIN